MLRCNGGPTCKCDPNVESEVPVIHFIHNTKEIAEHFGVPLDTNLLTLLELDRKWYETCECIRA